MGGRMAGGGVGVTSDQNSRHDRKMLALAIALLIHTEKRRYESVQIYLDILGIKILWHTLSD